jgi:hypothetical protein
MKPRQRIKRPALERNTPVRTWSTLFTPPSGKTADAAGPIRGAPEVGTPMDAVQRGVEFAYRVSDEYLRQGQAFARVISQPPGNAPAAPDGSVADLPRLTERMLRFSSELSTMWMEAMRMMANTATGSGLAQSAPAPAWWPREPAPPPPPPSPSAPRLIIKVDSPLRTRAALDLEEGAGRPLTVGPLRQSGGGARLRQVKVEMESIDGPVTVRIRVPARQSAGTYVGDIVDGSTGSTVGTVTIRVSR